MGIEILPQSPRSFLRSGLQLSAQKSADYIYLCHQASLSHRRSASAVLDGEQPMVFTTDCNLIIQGETAFDTDTKCPLFWGREHKKPSQNERYGSSERVQDNYEWYNQLILPDTPCPPRGKMF